MTIAIENDPIVRQSRKVTAYIRLPTVLAGFLYKKRLLTSPAMVFGTPCP
jgi:hypothetical protein